MIITKINKYCSQKTKFTTLFTIFNIIRRYIMFHLLFEIFLIISYEHCPIGVANYTSSFIDLAAMFWFRNIRIIKSYIVIF